MSYTQRRSTVAGPTYSTRNTIGGTSALPQSSHPAGRQTLAALPAHSMDGVQPRMTISGRITRTGSAGPNPVVVEISSTAVDIIAFANQAQIKIGTYDPGKYPVERAQQMYMTDFFKIFEEAMKVIDSGFELSQPPKKDGHQDLKEAKKNYLTSCVDCFKAMLIILDYPNLSDVDTVQVRFDNFQSMPPKVTLAAFKALQYIITIANKAQDGNGLESISNEAAFLVLTPSKRQTAMTQSAFALRPLTPSLPHSANTVAEVATAFGRLAEAQKNMQAELSEVPEQTEPLTKRERFELAAIAYANPGTLKDKQEELNRRTLAFLEMKKTEKQKQLDQLQNTLKEARQRLEVLTNEADTLDRLEKQRAEMEANRNDRNAAIEQTINQRCIFVERTAEMEDQMKKLEPERQKLIQDCKELEIKVQSQTITKDDVKKMSHELQEKAETLSQVRAQSHTAEKAVITNKDERDQQMREARKLIEQCTQAQQVFKMIPATAKYSRGQDLAFNVQDAFVFCATTPEEAKMNPPSSANTTLPVSENPAETQQQLLSRIEVVKSIFNERGNHYETDQPQLIRNITTIQQQRTEKEYELRRAIQLKSQMAEAVEARKPQLRENRQNLNRRINDMTAELTRLQTELTNLNDHNNRRDPETQEELRQTKERLNLRTQELEEITAKAKEQLLKVKEEAKRHTETLEEMVQRTAKLTQEKVEIVQKELRPLPTPPLV